MMEGNALPSPAVLMRLRKVLGGMRLSWYSRLSPFLYGNSGNTASLWRKEPQELFGVCTSLKDVGATGVLQKRFLADGRKLRDLCLCYPASKAYVLSRCCFKPSQQSFDAFKDWYGMRRNFSSEGK